MSADETPQPGPDAGLVEEVSTTLSKEERRARRIAETKMDLKWATTLLFVLILGLSGALWGSWRVPTATEENLPEMTRAIFSQDRLVVPFEILSVLLLAALIAGVVIAIREAPPGRWTYPPETPTADMLEQERED